MTSSLTWRGWLRLALCLKLVWVVQLAAPHAVADAFDAALARAVAAKERALEVNDPARWEEALRRFQEADAIRPSRETRYEVGVAAQQLDQYDLAVEAYEAALDMGLMGRARDKARAFVAEHAGEMARVEVRGPVGTELRISGLRRGTLPLRRPLVVFAGRLRLEAFLPDHSVQAHTLELGKGELEVVHLRDDSDAPAKSFPATEELDSSASSLGSATASPPSPGPEASGPAASGPAASGPAAQGPAPLAPAMPPSASPPLGPTEPTSAAPNRPGRGVGYALIGGGAVLSVGALVFVPLASNRIDEARDDLALVCQVPNGADGCVEAVPGQQGTAQSKVDAIETWRSVRTISYVGLGVGAASLLAGTIVVATRGRRSGSRAGDWRPAIVADPKGARLQVVGSF
jgi:hypothetical protein